jgi:hypothetical protein
MGQGDADKRAEMPERIEGGRRSTARAPDDARQGSTARDDQVDPENAELIEKVLRRENMLALKEAHNQAVAAAVRDSDGAAASCS